MDQVDIIVRARDILRKYRKKFSVYGKEDKVFIVVLDELPIESTEVSPFDKMCLDSMKVFYDESQKAYCLMTYANIS